MTRTALGRLAVLAGLAAIVLTGCGSPGLHVSANHNLFVDNPELSATAIGANRGCGNGAIAITTWDQGSVFGTDQTLLNSIPHNFGVDGSDVSGTSFVKSDGTTGASEVQRVYGDPQVVTLPDGRLLGVRATFRGFPFERRLSDNSSVAQPVVADDLVFQSWKEYVTQKIVAKFSTDAQQAAEAQWKLDHRLRTEERFYTSANCGKTWTTFARLDGLNFNCGAPVQGDNKTLTLADGTKLEEPTYRVPGFDRTELYADPWSGDVYMSNWCASNGVNHTRLFRLPAGTSTWTAIDDSSYKGLYVPVEMTTTKSGALWLYSCDSSVPTLRRSIDHGQSFVVVPLRKDAADKESCGEYDYRPNNAKFAGHGSYNVTTGAIARGGYDAVRIAYPTIDSGSQRIRRVGVSYKGGTGAANNKDQFLILVGDEVKPVDADAVMFHATFVEYSETVASEKTPNYDGLLYWLESSPSTGVMRVRVESTTAALNDSKPQELSNWAPPKPVPDNASFQGDYNFFLGDYVKGAAYCAADGAAHFVPIWPEESSAGYEIHDVDITLDRPCTPTPNKTPITPTSTAGGKP